MKKKEKLFSVTATDCRWDYYRGSGKGGQKKNKTSSCVRCTHKTSGASAYSETGRSQVHNKQTAFKKMANTDVFKKWLKIEISRKIGRLEDIECKINEAMKYVKIESRDSKGKWTKGLAEL